jgi:hypothetical protein
MGVEVVVGGTVPGGSVPGGVGAVGGVGVVVVRAQLGRHGSPGWRPLQRRFDESVVGSFVPVVDCLGAVVLGAGLVVPSP